MLELLPDQAEPILHQDILDITDKNRSNPLAWNGQFSPQLIRSLLTTYGVGTRTIFDPFAGSGTVAAESILEDKSFLGTEINPAGYLLARLYTLANLDASHRSQAVQECRSVLEVELNQVGVESIGPTGLLKPLNGLSEAARFVYCGILLIAFKNSNSTNAKQIKKASERIEKLIQSLPRAKCMVQLDLSDARRTKFDDDSCDMVITSPPYINVYNYHQQYRPIVEAMGCSPLMAAHTEIGSNRKHRGNRLLTVIQYCLDLAQTAAEISRICCQDSRAIFIIGRESNVLGHPFANAKMANEIFTESLGWKPCLRQERSFVNRFGQKIYEEVFHYYTSKLKPSPLQLEFARETGVNALKEARNNAHSSSKSFLDDAIDKNKLVMPSRLFEHKNVIPLTL